MKNQYFGDRNDYFKYGLAISLAKGLPDIVRFTFIPLLTPSDHSRDGQVVNYTQGSRHKDLFLFLRSCLQGSRDIYRPRKFFRQSQVSIEYCPYRDQAEFRHSERTRYFREIPRAHLRQAVILLDPDNGLEVKSSTASSFHKYVKYEEARSVFERMGEASLLLIYQHFPRVDRLTFLGGLHARLQKEPACPPPISVWDGRIAFIVLATSTARRRKAERQLTKYATSVGGLRVFPP